MKIHVAISSPLLSDTPLEGIGKLERDGENREKVEAFLRQAKECEIGNVDFEELERLWR